MVDVNLVKEELDIQDVLDILGIPVKKGSFLCPHHNDQQYGSCFINPKNKKRYRCFVCGEGGDIVDLVCQVNGVSFQEALQFLASYCSSNVKADKGDGNIAFLRRRVNQKMVSFLNIENSPIYVESANGLKAVDSNPLQTLMDEDPVTYGNIVLTKCYEKRVMIKENLRVLVERDNARTVQSSYVLAVARKTKKFKELYEYYKNQLVELEQYRKETLNLVRKEAS